MCWAPELTTVIRPAVSMPTSAVVNEASIRWFTSPAVVRSAVTSMPVITAYIAMPSSSRTMLVFHTTRSFSPDLVIASRSRTTGTPVRLGHMNSASTSVASEGVMLRVPDLEAQQLRRPVAGDVSRGRVDANNGALDVGDQDDAGGGVEGGAGQLLGDLEPVHGFVLGGDVQQLRREDRVVAGLGQQRERQGHPARTRPDQRGLHPPAVEVPH